MKEESMYMYSALLISCAALSGTLVMAGCTGRESKPTQPSLYDRLGGKAAITAVIDQFVANVAGDNRINARFATTDIPRLKGNLVDQFYMVTGGPCQYK
jgi:hemoglobin